MLPHSRWVLRHNALLWRPEFPQIRRFHCYL